MPSVKYYNRKFVREGKYNKNRIMNSILETPGITPHVIKRKIFEDKLSRPAIYSHLNELIKEKKIFKKGSGHYYPTDPNLVHVFKFSKHLERSIELIVDPLLFENQFNLWSNDSTSVTKLRRRVRGISISKDYFDTDFEDRNSEMKMLEFSTRIGALITYTLIESLRPLIRAKNSQSIREAKKRFASELIRRSLSIDKLSMLFLRFFSLPNTLFEGNDALTKYAFNEFAENFERIYPSLFQGLEEFWSDSVLNALRWNTTLAKENTDCIHMWKKFNLFKIDKPYYLCSQCGTSSTDPLQYHM